MSADLPAPVALDAPEESPAALSEVVSAVTGAAFRLGVLEAHLAGPAAEAPRWFGRDAAAAAAQVGAVSAVVRDAHAALTGAVRRLDRHADLLGQIRRRITTLRAEQEDDYGALAHRLSVAGPCDGPGSPSQAAVLSALGDELRAAEAARRREHTALLAELRSDALETARVLAGATALVGGTGRSGDANRVVACLAAKLPGWGDGELTARASALASALSGPVRLEQIETLARGNAPCAGVPLFAGALLGALGVSGVGYLLTTLGREPEAADAPLARLLAASFGAARPTGGLVGRVQEVLDGQYVTSTGTDDPDTVALGMGAVLAAGAALSGGGVRPATAAAWGVQMLERERALGMPAVGRVPGHRGADPVRTVLTLLGESGDPDACAVLLAHRNAWAALLTRSPGADGLLSHVVHLASAAPGAGGAVAARSGLEALGSGLSPAGADSWAVRPDAAGIVAPSLGRLVAAHVDAAGALLQEAGGRVGLSAGADAALRGLAYLTVTPGAASAVADALTRWAGTTASGSVTAAASVLGSFLAVREYGQRLAHALQAAQAQEAAVDRQITFDIATLPLEAVKGFPAVVLDAGASTVAQWVHADGSWSIGPDRGPSFDGRDAAAAAAATVPPAEQFRAHAAAASARTAFGQTMAHLGIPHGPEPDHWEDGILDEATSDLPEVLRELFGHPAVRLPR